MATWCWVTKAQSISLPNFKPIFFTVNNTQILLEYLAAKQTHRTANMFRRWSSIPSVIKHSSTHCIVMSKYECGQRKQGNVYRRWIVCKRESMPDLKDVCFLRLIHFFLCKNINKKTSNFQLNQICCVVHRLRQFVHICAIQWARNSWPFKRNGMERQTMRWSVSKWSKHRNTISLILKWMRIESGDCGAIHKASTTFAITRFCRVVVGYRRQWNRHRIVVLLSRTDAIRNKRIVRTFSIRVNFNAASSIKLWWYT